MFADNPFKVQLIKAKVPEEGYTSAYRCGKLIDLCTGPHIQCSDRVKGFKVTKNSSAYWLANKDNDDLQRVYGISFPKHAQL
jgi:threonyl-tRNA synthetase